MTASLAHRELRLQQSRHKSFRFQVLARIEIIKNNAVVTNLNHRQKNRGMPLHTPSHASGDQHFRIALLENPLINDAKMSVLSTELI
jgi:hypothetical protein